tara:strand:+ start:1832 stop:3262 length:1431 start_codon:yes stop_codon:yes gene_type:complete
MLLTKISDYINCKKIYNLNTKNINFKYISSNSKNIKKNSIFVIDKKNKNNNYINDAIKKGAVGLLTEKYIKNIKITQFVVNNIDSQFLILLRVLRPNKPLNSIAVTGTNGKTSVVCYVSQILNFYKKYNKTYGTLGFYINKKKQQNSSLTTPEFDVLYQNAFSKKKNNYNFIFEASSHAIKQKRIKNFPINIAAITNISHDHLDYHKNFKNYKETKLKLFTKFLNNDGCAILNDKIIGINLLKKKLIKNKIITYGLKNSNINLVIKNKKTEIKFFEKKFILNINSFSSIELENISCAIGCCAALNLRIEKILKILKKLKQPPGRLEEVIFKNKKFKIFIDYAHTPDALKRVLINKTINNKKPHIVFGCGGNRDKQKRYKMGSIANLYADKVYITDDNPRDEKPEIIRKMILQKCKKGVEISNRKEAISISIKNLKKNDILIIAGKGHEKLQIKKKSTILFDDLKVAQNELKKISNE